MIPCGQMLNLTFMFGGVAYPIHPLDVVDDNFNKVDANGKKVCIGAVCFYPSILLSSYQTL